MTLKVLLNRSAIDVARLELRKKNISFLPSPLGSLFRRVLRKLGFGTSPDIGDWVKSWDVLETIAFVERNVSREVPILDIGAYACEILVALNKLGYKQLHGIDLDKRIALMPRAGEISYSVGDFHRTPFQDGTFGAITSISVIEHGYRPDELFMEMSRLLKPNGYFIASFDYWPEKIDTTSERFFGMDWLIFSRNDVEELIASAQRYGLSPLGVLDFTARERPIPFGGKQYTFGWLVLQKTA
jgi:SAM-dependent methyltransferase